MGRRIGVVASAFGLLIALVIATGAMAQTSTGEVTVTVQIPTAMSSESGFWNFGYVGGEDLLQRRRVLGHANADPDDPLRYRSRMRGAWNVESTCDPATYPDMVWDFSASYNRQPLDVTVNNVRIVGPTLSYYSQEDINMIWPTPFSPGINLAFDAVKYGRVKFEDHTNGNYDQWPGLEQVEIDALMRISVNWKTASSIDPHIVTVNPLPGDPDWGVQRVKFAHTFACDELFPSEQPTGP